MKFIPSLHVIGFLILISTANAQIFPDLEGQDLLDQVALNYTPTIVLDYSDARDTMYSRIYNHDDSVTCVYSSHTLYLPPDGDPSINLYMGGSNAGINAEHTWPQSMGAGDGNARSDMHHLYPTRTGVNAARGNLPFAEIPDEQTTQWYYLTSEISNTPTSNIDLYSERINGQFEPREDHKGNVARAMFYFNTIYHDEAISANPLFFEAQRETLCEWHFLDPADSIELVRTHMIAAYQNGKPNPFVIDCSVAARTYCSGMTEECPVLISSVASPKKQLDLLTIYPNPTSGIFSISGTEQPSELTITDLTGRQLMQLAWTPGQRVDVGHLQRGAYLVFVKNGGGSFVGRVVRE